MTWLHLSPQYTARVTHVLESKKRMGWVQDSQKRKVQVTKDNFFPVPLGRNRKEIASSWFQDLAGSKPLVQLAKKVWKRDTTEWEFFCNKIIFSVNFWVIITPKFCLSLGACVQQERRDIWQSLWKGCSHLQSCLVYQGIATYIITVPCALCGCSHQDFCF